MHRARVPRDHLGLRGFKDLPAELAAQGLRDRQGSRVWVGTGVLQDPRDSQDHKVPQVKMDQEVNQDNQGPRVTVVLKDPKACWAPQACEELSDRREGRVLRGLRALPVLEVLQDQLELMVRQDLSAVPVIWGQLDL